MNKLLFSGIILSILLIASASAWSVRDLFTRGSADDAALSPGYPGSVCRASSSVNAREVSACTKVTAPLGLFNRLETTQLLVRTANNLPNEGSLFEYRDGLLSLRTVFANGGTGDGVLVLDDLVVAEGTDLGSLNVVDLRGAGNATVCVDTYGHIYRSLTPCR